MEKIKVKAINTSNHEMPEYKTMMSAGMDLRAVLENEYELQPGERKLFFTGLKISLPEGFEAQIRPRSGLAYKYGITVLNSPGTVDADYRDEIGVLLINLSDKLFTIHDGDRIAQMVVARHAVVEFEEVEDFSDDNVNRNGGFGHTGIK